ncbi:MAG: RNA methyltransferase [Acidobacteria bacterium]|nr:RNA methyltransferase [Acidobacteriota bacterium]
MPRITRRQDAIVTRFRDVAKGAADDGAVVIDGVHLLLDALRAGVPVETVLATSDLLADASQDVAQTWRLARAADVPIHEATAGVIEAASPVRTPSGVVAIARWSPAPLAGLWTPAPALVIGLVDVQDPGNAGAVIRSADGLGATGVAMIGATADPGSAKSLRGAMGSTFRVPVARASIGESLRAARAAGATIAATTAPAPGTTDLHAADLTGPVFLLLGNEGAGLPGQALKAADIQISIAMRPGINSFNVAVSSALLLYEARLQRNRR